MLHTYVEHITYHLARRGVKAGDRVVVLGSKRVATVATLLAVASLGAVFVPVDPTTPAARLEFLLEDLEPTMIATVRTELTSAVINLVERYPHIDIDDVSLHVGRVAPRFRRASVMGRSRPQGADLAYILYTSGSSGRPKGVMIEHRQVAAFFKAHNARAKIQAGDRCLNTGPLHFDVCVMDILLPLSLGAFVRLGPSLPLPRLVLPLLEQERITHFYAVGTVLRLITGSGPELAGYDLSSLRLLQTGAEPCSPAVVNEWLKRWPNLMFLNSYGPTEVTVGCLSYVAPAKTLLAGDVPIGKPHAGTRLLIVGLTGTPLRRAGEIGELLLGGAQVMRGYWKRPADDARAFVIVEGRRYYRSGDLAYRSESGQVHYAGRVDAEFKIQGCRVHPNEILARILECPGVLGAAVRLRQTRNGRSVLEAAVSKSRGVRSTKLELAIRCHLTRHLPIHMHPERFAFLSRTPQLSTGKFDQRTTLGALDITP